MPHQPHGVRRAEPGRRAALLLLLGLLLVVLAGCGGSAQPSLLGPESTPGLSDQQVQDLEQRALNSRVQALQHHDLKAFLSTVDQRDPALVHRQTRYFRNLVQLPVATISYQVLAQQWPGVTARPAWGSVVHTPRVVLSLQLRDFDDVPVVRTVGFVMAVRHGRAEIVDDRDASGSPLFEGTPSPWDLTAITAVQRGGVLGIFDSATRDLADIPIRRVYRKKTRMKRH